MPIGACKLCGLTRELIDSHLIPRGVYQLMRAPDLSNPNPVVLTQDVVLQTSKQIKDYVLCAECEDLFNKNGEKWTLANMAGVNGSFPLWNAIKEHDPIYDDELLSVYGAANIPAVRVDKLVYFALSVFWRSSAHQWQTIAEMPDVDLGPYSEPVRKFLREQADFPDNVIIILYLWPEEANRAFAYYPLRMKAKGFHSFQFYIPGIQFWMLTGQRISPELRAVGSQFTSRRLIPVGKGAHKNGMLLMMETFTGARKPQQELTDWLAAPDPRKK